MLEVEERASAQPTRALHEFELQRNAAEFRSLLLHFVTELFSQIFRTLWAHKLVSFLTMFGIAWGVGSLLLLVGLGEGFQSGNKNPRRDEFLART